MMSYSSSLYKLIIMLLTALTVNTVNSMDQGYSSTQVASRSGESCMHLRTSEQQAHMLGL